MYFKNDKNQYDTFLKYGMLNLFNFDEKSTKTIAFLNFNNRKLQNWTYFFSIFICVAKNKILEEFGRDLKSRKGFLKNHLIFDDLSKQIKKHFDTYKVALSHLNSLIHGKNEDEGNFIAKMFGRFKFLGNN